MLDNRGKEILKELMQKLNNEKVYFVIGHKMQGYEKAIIDISKEIGKKFEINAIIPKKITKEVGANLLNKELNGVCISTEQEELGIYKSFNYEIFERRKSITTAKNVLPNRKDVFCIKKPQAVENKGLQQISGVPEEIRTPDPTLRRRVLYPAELLGHVYLPNHLSGFLKKCQEAAPKVARFFPSGRIQWEA